MNLLSPELDAKRAHLLATLSSMNGCVVAFSGGVDSGVLAKAAHLALGERAVAVTGASASLSSGEREQACELAQAIGVRHEVIATNEFSNPRYTTNAPDRCFHCKSELYQQLSLVAARMGSATIVNGANVDDRGEFRPGMRAADEFKVRSPLIECGFTKSDIRQLADFWQLAVASKPATPCLSSRIAYGQAVTPERLAMVDKAEQFLRSLGFQELRVRYHAGDMARIELSVDQLQLLANDAHRVRIVQELRQLGFKFVTLDLAGFRSGSLAQLVAVEELRRFNSQ